jgi:molecular chaperone HtpG
MSAATTTRESHVFQAEVSRLLHLMVHAVYTEKVIFLRELISNASDACDKLRYEAIARPELMGEGEAAAAAALAIRLEPDKDAGTLTIADNGIGMDHGELVANLGTIARSGTRAFLDKLTEAKDGSSLIGQFGVGFYSAFMVADEIEVTSRRAGTAEAYVWRSNGADGFSIEAASPEAAAACLHGTRVTLKLKDDAREFLDAHEIERIVRTYSDNILFPIMLAEGEGEPRQINAASALWQRSKSEVAPEEYKEAYRTITGGFDEQALTLHYKAEGRQEYAVLLFVPKMRPFDLYDPTRKGRVKLYVRRVFITDDADLMPSYLRFVRGVVDSEDVPLNISREMLQNNPLVAQIRKALTQRVLTELEATAGKDAKAFEELWETFGAVMKEGIYEDYERRDQLMKLARFRSSISDGWRSLADYVAGMKTNQTEIYYLVGDSAERLKASPQLEAARARGLEVLLLTDPIDHFWTSSQPGFEGKPLRSLSKGDVDLSLIPLAETEGATPAETPATDTDALVARLKVALGDTVSDVRASKRLVTSAVCLVAPGGGPDRGLEKLLARQERGPGTRPVLEINTGHALVKGISARSAGADETEIKELAGLLLDQAYILEGEAPADPALFAERMNRLLVKALGA